MPTVSVVIPSYNHEKFVAECVQSVLDQTYQDFEIIITDDNSTDRTVEIIEGFHDPRIKFFKHSKNKGVCVAVNNCIRNARGKYIAWLSSDDRWYPNKLAVQARYLDENQDIAAVFGKVDWIDENGRIVTHLPFKNVYEVENRTRFEWLRYFFYMGNCLSIPCSLIRKECYAEVGMFNPAFASVPDFDQWVRLCLRHDIWILDQKLLQNRWIGNNNNASGDNIKNRFRVRFEYRHILDHYLGITNPDELLLIFPDAGKYGHVTTELIPYFLGRIAIASHWDFKMLWGLDVIYTLLQDKSTVKALESKCDFTYLDFIKLAGECDPFRISNVVTTSQIIDDHRSPLRMFLSATKRYIKETISVVHHLFIERSENT